MATPDQIRRGGRWSLASGTVLAALLFAAIAYADTINVTNDVVLNSSSDTKVPGGSGVLHVYLAVSTPDSQNGCNATGASPMTVSVTSGDTTRVAINSPGTVTLTGCGSGSAVDRLFRARHGLSRKRSDHRRLRERRPRAARSDEQSGHVHCERHGSA
jgi:hypothetical protein